VEEASQPASAWICKFTTGFYCDSTFAEFAGTEVAGIHRGSHRGRRKGRVMDDVTRAAQTKNYQESPCWRTKLSNARCTADGGAESNSASSSNGSDNGETTATEAEAVTPVTLRARSRHLILSRPFESFHHPFRACFRFRLLRPSSWFRVPRRKSVPRTLLDSHLPEDLRAPTWWCKQKRIEIQIGITCMKLDRCSPTDSRT